jgi:glycine/serine hydroxymethyltransferase
MKTEGARAEKILEEINISVNKNTCPGDKSALRPGGLRIGTPAITSRKMKEADIEKVAEFVHRGTCADFNKSIFLFVSCFPVTALSLNKPHIKMSVSCPFPLYFQFHVLLRE